MINIYIKEKCRTLLQSERKDYATTFLATGLIQGCNIITGILTARFLGPIGKGELTTVLWLPSLVLAVGSFSLPQAAAFHVSRNPTKGNVITAVSFWISLILGAIEAAILYPFLPLILGSNNANLILMSRIFLLYLPITFVGLTLLGIEQGYQRFARYNYLRLLPTVFYLLYLIGLAILRTASVRNILVGNLISQLVASLTLTKFASKDLVLKGIRIWRAQGKTLLRQGLLYSLPALSGIILMRADLAILIHMVSPEEVGYYSAALAVAMGQNGLASSLIQVNFPKVSTISSGKAAFVIRRQLNKSIVPLTLMGITVALCSPLIIKYLFGPAFIAAQKITIVLVATITIWGIGQIVENGLRGLGLGLPGAVANLVGFLSLLISASYFVRTYKALGMAISLMLSQVIVTILLIAYLRRINLQCRE